MEDQKLSQDVHVQALKECQSAREQLGQQLTYLTADFENFRRRTEKDRIQWSLYAQAEILKKILPIVDDFDRAFNTTPAPELQAHIAGFELIYKHLQKMLKELGVEEITDVQNFNPERHEAVMHAQVEGKEPGSIAAILQKGYSFKGIILRPAKVSIVA